MNEKNIKPFIKWVGGKRQFIKYIDSILPEKFNDYYEPFVGGGAVFFHLCKNDLIKNKSFINDINKRLIITYKIVKSNPKGLMKKLDKYEKQSNEKFYLNDRVKIENYKTYLKISAWFIYMNKAGFNGLYRVNSKGGYNVPYGKNDFKKLYIKNNILDDSHIMNKINVVLTDGDYKKSIKNIKKGDFIFIDPPYDYEENKKNGFTKYANPDFKKDMQIELSEEIKKIHAKGAYFILTNHNTRLINSLYNEFNITILKANRFINSNSKKRINSSEEVFIKNY